MSQPGGCIWEAKPLWADDRGLIWFDEIVKCTCIDMTCCGNIHKDRNWGYQNSSKGVRHLVKEVVPGMDLFVWILLTPCCFPCMFGCLPMHEAITLHIDDVNECGLVVEKKSKSCCFGDTMSKRIGITDVNVTYTEGGIFAARKAEVIFSSENDAPLDYTFYMQSSDSSGPGKHNTKPEIEAYLNQVRNLIDQSMSRRFEQSAPGNYAQSYEESRGVNKAFLAPVPQTMQPVYDGYAQSSGIPPPPVQFANAEVSAPVLNQMVYAEAVPMDQVSK